MRVDEHTTELEGVPVYFRRAEPEGQADTSAPPGPGGPAARAAGATPLYLHGVPTSSDDWVEFLERGGGVAPDLIGFGRTGKGGHLEYTMQSLGNFVDNFVDNLGLGRLKLVMHDWGAAVGLALAMRHPERVERLVILNGLPLFEGFRWHRMARIWRRPLLGELAMGMTNRRLLARALRSGSVRPDAWPDARVDAVWQQFDQGTQRAILRLYRSADEAALARAGLDLPAIGCPALVVWGGRDPWLAPELGEVYAKRLPRATLDTVADGGHWPWLDDPSVIDCVIEFLDG